MLCGKRSNYVSATIIESANHILKPNIFTNIYLIVSKMFFGDDKGNNNVLAFFVVVVVKLN